MSTSLPPSTRARTAAVRVATTAVLVALAAGGTAGTAAAAPSAGPRVEIAGLSPGATGVDLSHGIDTCVQGFVWREARPSDHVCVSADDRDRTAQENALAASRVSPGTNGNGPNACAIGFVWREAYPEDLVCVTPDRRDRAQFDNEHANERFVRSGIPIQDRLQFVFTTWMETWDVANGSLVVMRDGKIIRQFAKGPAASTTQVTPLASLSKAVTGACAMTLIDKGLLSFTTTLGSMPTSFKEQLGILDNAEVKAITIEQLLRNTSGITSDPIDGKRLVGAPTDDTVDLVLIKEALAAELGPKDTPVYNNINYLILGRVIESLSGEKYEPYCKRTVLTPLGAPNARIGIAGLGAGGGWEMPPVEYASFARAFDPTTGLLSPAAHAFIDGVSRTDVSLESLGVFVREIPGGRNVYHFGAWQSTATTPGEFGSFFAMYGSGITVVATFDKFPTDTEGADMRGTLDAALGEMAFSKP